jgi:hypothetical protein
MGRPVTSETNTTPAPLPVSASQPDLLAISLPTLADRANMEHHAAEDSARSALDHARNAGVLLLAAKDRVEHGDWESWLRVNFRGSQRTAQVYMRIAARWDDITSKTQRVADLPIRRVTALLAKPVAEPSEKPALPKWLPEPGQMAIGTIFSHNEYRTYIIGRRAETSEWVHIYRDAGAEIDGAGILDGTKRGVRVEDADHFLRSVLQEDRADGIEWNVFDAGSADDDILLSYHKLLNPDYYPLTATARRPNNE